MGNNNDFGDEQRLSIREAAHFLKVSERTIRRLVDSGVLPAQRVGRQLRLRKGDLKGDLGQQKGA